MYRFKKGEAAWLYWNDKETGFPQMYHRPCIITKKIHPASFKVAFVANDPERPVSEWKLDRHEHEHHPSDMLAYSDVQSEEDNRCNADDHLEALRDQWKVETPIAKQEAWWKSEADRKCMNEELNRTLRPILARMMG